MTQRDELAAGGSLDSLERAYIQEYLRSQGYTLELLRQLPVAESHRLMRDASLYASVRLSEVENRSHLVEDLHGGPPPM